MHHLPTLKSNRYKGSIKPSELMAALEYPIDQSEFIVLIIGYLDQHYTKEVVGLSEELNQWRDLYHQTKYKEILEKIEPFFVEHRDKDRAIFEKVLATIDKIKPIEIHHNYSRRFYENRVSALYQGNILNQPNNLEKLNRLLEPLTKIKVDSLDNLNRAIVMLDNAPLVKPIANERGETLKNMTSLYNQKDRASMRLGKTTTSSKRDMFFSNNPGMMTSLTPNIRDELTSNVLINSVPDRGALLGFRSGFSHSNPQIPFAGSVSGHAYGMLALVEDYAHKNAGNPELKEDINLALQAFMHVFVAYGFHSYGEMNTVFDQEEMHSLFGSQDYKLDIPSDILNSAFKDTQEYTKAVILKKAALVELFDNKAKKAILAKDWKALSSELLKLSESQRYEMLEFILDTYLRNGLDAQFLSYLKAHGDNNDEEELFHIMLELRPNLIEGDFKLRMLSAELQHLRNTYNHNTYLREALINNPLRIDLVSFFNNLSLSNQTDQVEVMQSIRDAPNQIEELKTMIIFYCQQIDPTFNDKRSLDTINEPSLLNEIKKSLLNLLNQIDETPKGSKLPIDHILASKSPQSAVMTLGILSECGLLDNHEYAEIAWNHSSLKSKENSNNNRLSTSAIEYLKKNSADPSQRENIKLILGLENYEKSDNLIRAINNFNWPDILDFKPLLYRFPLDAYEISNLLQFKLDSLERKQLFNLIKGNPEDEIFITTHLRDFAAANRNVNLTEIKAILASPEFQTIARSPLAYKEHLLTAFVLLRLNPSIQNEPKLMNTIIKNSDNAETVINIIKLLDDPRLLKVKEGLKYRIANMTNRDLEDKAVALEQLLSSQRLDWVTDDQLAKIVTVILERDKITCQFSWNIAALQQVFSSPNSSDHHQHRSRILDYMLEYPKNSDLILEIIDNRKINNATPPASIDGILKILKDHASSLSLVNTPSNVYYISDIAKLSPDLLEEVLSKNSQTKIELYAKLSDLDSLMRRVKTPISFSSLYFSRFCQDDELNDSKKIEEFKSLLTTMKNSPWIKRADYPSYAEQMFNSLTPKLAAQNDQDPRSTDKRSTDKRSAPR